MGTYHEAQVSPLVKEITVDINAVWLREIVGDELSDGGEISRFLAAMILNVAKLGRKNS